MTLPKSFVKARKVKPGQPVFVESDADLDVVQIRTKGNGISSITPEFKQWLDRVTRENEDLIKELAKR